MLCLEVVVNPGCLEPRPVSLNQSYVVRRSVEAFAHQAEPVDLRDGPAWLSTLPGGRQGTMFFNPDLPPTTGVSEKSLCQSFGGATGFVGGPPPGAPS